MTHRLQHDKQICFLRVVSIQSFIYVTRTNSICNMFDFCVTQIISPDVARRAILPSNLCRIYHSVLRCMSVCCSLWYDLVLHATWLVLVWHDALPPMWQGWSFCPSIFVECPTECCSVLQVYEGLRTKEICLHVRHDSFPCAIFVCGMLILFYHTLPLQCLVFTWHDLFLWAK